MNSRNARAGARTLASGLAIWASLHPWTARAESDYPADKPITIIVPFSAGSGTDVVARALTVSLAQLMKGATFIVDNRPGANGIIAAGLAAKSAPDGYTLLLTTHTTQSVNPFIYKKLPYDPNADFIPIALLGETAPALLAPTTASARSVKDVVAAAKQSKDGLNFATTNTSSLAATELFEQRLDLKIAVVKYKLAPQALTDLTGGTIDYFFGDLASGGALVRGGKLKALAVLSDKRLPGFPDVPTIAETGYPGLEVAIWIGLFAPKGTPAAVIQKLNAAVNAAQKQPELVKALADAAINVKSTSPQEFATYVAEQYVRWAKLAHDLNLEIE